MLDYLAIYKETQQRLEAILKKQCCVAKKKIFFCFPITLIVFQLQCIFRYAVFHQAQVVIGLNQGFLNEPIRKISTSTSKANK